MTDRPWTPGPWQFNQHDRNVLTRRDPVWEQHAIVVAESETPCGVSLDADGELIALAPEMAEAILGWRERMDDFAEQLEHWHPNVKSLWDAAERLRAIGASDE